MALCPFSCRRRLRLATPSPTPLGSHTYAQTSAPTALPGRQVWRARPPKRVRLEARLAALREAALAAGVRLHLLYILSPMHSLCAPCS
jgi:hypothetical protein